MKIDITKDQGKITAFLKDHPEFVPDFEGRDICLAGYGGSFSYGTNIETSDIDIKGVYMNPADEIIGIMPDSEQVVSKETDTTIYSMKKMLKLLCSCNPNTIEMLGLRDSEYILIDPVGQMLLDNKNLFITKRAAKTFSGYASSQLNRLVNKSGRAKEEISKNEVRSLTKQLKGLRDRYGKYGDVKAYEKEGQVFLDIDTRAFPIEALSPFLNEINAVKHDYDNSSRNEKATEHNKLSKHMMHLIRLYMTGIDMMHGELKTYRDGSDHELLMAIRRGDYLESDKKTPTEEFKKLLKDYQMKFDKAVEASTIPDEPDMKKVNDLFMEMVKVNGRI